MKKSKKQGPLELSSKKSSIHNTSLSTISHNPKHKSRDPRFENQCGQYNEKRFHTDYSFLDEYKKEEIDLLAKELVKEKNVEKKAKIHSLLQKHRTERIMRERSERNQQYIKEITLNSDGSQNNKNPFYLKKSVKRKLELIAQFEELKKAGKLKQFMQRKRKHQRSKDRKRFPTKYREIHE